MIFQNRESGNDKVIFLNWEKGRFITVEEETIGYHIGIGIHRNVVENMVFLTRSPEATITAIQRGTNLPLPKISISLRYIDEQGWIESRMDLGADISPRSSG